MSALHRAQGLESGAEKKKRSSLRFGLESRRRGFVALQGRRYGRSPQRDHRSTVSCFPRFGTSMQGSKTQEEALAEVDKEGHSPFWSLIWEDHGGPNDLIKSIMWSSTDYLRHVVRKVEERSAVTFTYVCERCKMFPVPWCVTPTMVKRRENSMSGWWCGACGMPCDDSPTDCSPQGAGASDFSSLWSARWRLRQPNLCAETHHDTLTKGKKLRFTRSLRVIVCKSVCCRSLDRQQFHCRRYHLRST